MTLHDCYIRLHELTRHKEVNHFRCKSLFVRFARPNLRYPLEMQSYGAFCMCACVAIFCFVLLRFAFALKCKRLHCELQRYSELLEEPTENWVAVPFRTKTVNYAEEIQIECDLFFIFDVFAVVDALIDC